MTIKIVAAGIVGAMICSTAMRAQSQNGDLSKVTHERTLTFMTRDHSCTKGRIAQTGLGSITVQDAANSRTYLKSDLLFVGENFQNRNILLSGRSSWYDVTHALPEGHELLRITLKSGETVSDSKIKLLPTALSIGPAKHPRIIAKQEISTVEYVRYLPGTDRQDELAYKAEALNLFQPWFYREKFGHPPTVAVKLYDAALTEDNTELRCK
jgi:hypothetical protein